jgi:hypothetical protein
LLADYQTLKQAILAQYTAFYALQGMLKLVSKIAASPMRTEETQIRYIPPEVSAYGNVAGGKQRDAEE